MLFTSYFNLYFILTAEAEYFVCVCVFLRESFLCKYICKLLIYRFFPYFFFLMDLYLDLKQ